MRVRITKPLTGSIDGIQLGRLSKGRVYDVNTPLACYLLSEEMAELVSSDVAPVAVPVVRKTVEQAPAKRSRGLLFPRSIAADRARTYPKKRKHKKEE
jgi:hypothetical protein